MKKFKAYFQIYHHLSIIELFELRKNYKKLNYSITEINFQIQKILSYPFYLCFNDYIFINNNV